MDWAFGVILEETEKRWLVHDQAAKQLGSFSGQPKNDRGAEGIPDDVCRAMLEMLDERRQIGDIVEDAALAFGALAAAMPAPVICNNPKRR